MTPPAMTAAGRVAGRVSTTRLPRRLSGPLAGRQRPARERRHAIPAPRRGTLGVRTLEVVRSLPDRALIDRLVRGRAWISVLGILLAGLVAMQVEILKLGTATGRAMERTAALQAQNESLQAGVATLADDQRIERLAGGMGMVMPSPSTVVFLAAHSHGAVGRALANIHVPDPAGFTAQLAAQVAAAAALAPAPAPATTTTSATPAPPGGAPAGTAPTPTPTPTASQTPTPSAAPAATSSGTAQAAAPGSGTTAPGSGAAAPGSGTTSAGSAPLPATGAAGVGPAVSGQPGSSGG